MVVFPQRFQDGSTSRPFQVVLSFSVLGLLLFVTDADGAVAIKGGRAVSSRARRSICDKKSSFQLPQEGIPSLTQGQSVSKEMNGGDVHAYKIILAKDSFVHVVVEQEGINVALNLFDPDRKLIGEMDSPNNTIGPEHISLVPETTGEYRLEVRSTEKWANPGHYVLSVTDFRPATPADLKRVAAERAFIEAEHYSDPKDEDLQKQKMSLAQSRQRAIETFKKALADWQALDDAHGEGMTFYRIGANYKLLGDSDQAIENFDNGLKALGNRAPEEDWRLAAGIMNDAGVVYIGRDVQKALRLFEQAKQLFEAHNDKRGLASSYNNIGVAFHSSGNIREALDYYLKSLPIRRAEHQLSSETNLENNIGGIYDSLGDPRLALEHYERALSLWRESKNRDKIPVGLNNVAKVEDELGEWQEAKKKYEEALALYSGDKTGEASTLVNLGALYDTLGDPETALEKYNSALIAVASVKNKRLTVTILTRIGQVNVALGNLEEALKSYNDALNQDTDLRAVDPSSRASTLTGIGTVTVLRREPQRALEYYLEALKLTTQVEDRRGQAITHQKIGETYVSLGNLETASDEYQASLKLWRAVSDQRGEAATLNDMGVLEQQRNNLAAALEYSEQATQKLESARTSISSHKLRTSYFADHQNYYELNIDLKMALARQDPASSKVADALAANERSRARTLLDMLAQDRLRIATDSSDELLRAENEVHQKVRAKLEAQTALLSGKHTESEAIAIAKELSQLLTQEDEIEGRIRSENPKYSNLTQPRIPAVNALQQQIEDNTVLLEYSLGEQRSYVWAVTSNSIDGFELPARKQIEAAASRIVKSIADRSRTVKGETGAQGLRRLEQADREFDAASAELSNLVIHRVAPLLGTKRLVIVADGALQRVSFAALPLPRAGAQQQRRLIDDHEIIYEPSASVLALQRTELGNRQSAREAAAILADPVFGKDDSRVAAALRLINPPRNEQNSNGNSGPAIATPRREVSRALEDIGLERFPRLDSSAIEAQKIAAAAKLAGKGKVKTAVDFDASRETAMSSELSEYRIVHFATHAVINYEHPDLSGIVLSMVDRQGQPQDGYLRLHDIYNLNLPADLVVLSACQTGIGKEIKGEGLIALTRGFMYAGAQRVIASLWKVDDVATADLMAEFYKQVFADGQRPAAALRAAQLKLAKRRPPADWAGFVLQGEWK